jgi:hypothetical protein
MIRISHLAKMPSKSIRIEIEKYRNDPGLRRWELPAWGHPFGQGILPLLISFEDCLFPIGTAFTIGQGVTFLVSAAHNIREAWRYEERLSHLLTAREIPESVALKHAGFSVLHHRPNGNGGASFLIWPMETVEGAPPTDIVIGYPQFQTEAATLVNRLSFDLPPIGEKVWSVGYCKFKFPKGGIPLAAVRAGSFDWEHEYSHKLIVVEGYVERIFTQRFADGYVEGPCFTFDAEIAHAQSGGPVLSPEGIVRGINSAGASSFFGRPASIASLLYPLLFMNIRFGAQIGPVRINATHPLFNLITHGTIPTDGSEERAVIGHDVASNRFYVNPRIERSLSAFVHDDFAGFQGGKPATAETRQTYRLRPLAETAEGSDDQ